MFFQLLHKLLSNTKLYSLIACLSLLTFIQADELTVDPPPIWKSECTTCLPAVSPIPPSILTPENVIVDLANPLYESGVLSTEHGGVLSTSDLRIQAQNISYIRKLDETPPVFNVSCQKNILIDYQNWVLVGETLYYDFLEHKGYLINGRTAKPPWSIGGREILLLENGELIILDGYITTSEGEFKDISIYSPRICLSAEGVISATHVQVRVYDTPVFWFPKFKFDLNNIGRSPFAVKFGWGGFLGSYLSLLYHFLSWNDLEATARFDAFFGKGVGVGIETAYDPDWKPTQFFTRNYFANDISLDDPHRRDRYRFQGTYYDRLRNTTINGMYDIVSDPEMAADYTTRDFDLQTAGRTELELRRQECDWIALLFTRVRTNHFQSVNQELPTVQLNVHPFEVPRTGIVFQNTLKASYLDYVFSDEVEEPDFSSGRFSMHPFLYRPFFFGPITATPEVGLIGIAYTNSPEGRGAVGQTLGELGIKLESALSKCTTNWKHVLEPYLHYHYLTPPTVSTDNHFIFTINDGWDHLNLCRFGIRNSFFTKGPCRLARPLWVDLWANAFFDTKTIPEIIPRGYINAEWMPFPTIFVGLDAAWHFSKGQLDFYNMRINWTINEDLALRAEYRHRSRYDWRKADFYNFILESVRPQEQLLESPLSDQRNTVLLQAFIRVNADWCAKIDLRNGWNRIFDHIHQPSYFEYQLELARVIFQHWRMTFIFEKREAGNRLSFSLLLDPGPPLKRKPCF